MNAFLLNNLAQIITGVIIAVVSTLLISSVSLFWKKTHQTPEPAEATKRLFSALQRYEKLYGPLFSPASLHIKIPLEYVNMSDPLDRANSISDIYQDDGNMVLLGKTGSGKSTSLKELTLKLIKDELKKGKNGEEARFPIFLPLDKWPPKRKPLKVWLTEYLMKREHFNLGLGKYISYLTSKGRFVLVLDGLDEMSEEDAQECLDAIDKWRKESDFPPPVIISCQLDYYAGLKKKGILLEKGTKKIVIQKLNPSQGQDYLEQRKETDLSRFVYHDEKGRHLREIVDTPLLLSLLVQTKQPISDIETEDALWKGYVDRAISEEKLYNGQDARYWLRKLAKYMPHNTGNNPTFYFHPDNLPGRSSQHIYKATKGFYVSSIWFIIFSFGIAACLLVVFGGFPLWQLLPLFAIIASFYGYLSKSILTGFYMMLLYIFTLRFPTFSIESSQGKTSRQKIAEVLVAWAFIFSPVILLVAASLILVWAMDMPIWLIILVIWVIGGLFWYVFGRLRGLSFLQRLIDKSTVMVAWFELRDLMVFRQVDDLLLFFEKLPRMLSMFIGIVSGVMIWFIAHAIWQTNILVAAMLLGMSIWLDLGLGGSMQASLLRFCFWRAEILPLTAEFLDEVVIHKILVRQGNRYKFFYDDIRKYLIKDKTI